MLIAQPPKSQALEPTAYCAAVWVGGESRRMGGQPKGLLRAPDGQLIVVRTAQLLAAALPGSELVLVGAHPAYGALGMLQVADNPPGIGPLGGLLGVLHHAEKLGLQQLVALSCDLPYLTPELVSRLSRFAPGAHAVAPRAVGAAPFSAPVCAESSAPASDGAEVPAGRRARPENSTRNYSEPWQPLFARYSVPEALRAALQARAAGASSLQRVLQELGSAVQELPLTPAEQAQLRDWDSPADMRG